MGHRGIHFARYNSNVQRKSPSPHKPPPTHYYMSDGSGRDSYVLKNNGGSRQEYKSRELGDHVFYDSLRSDQRSPLRHFVDPENDRAEITSYLNWPSIEGKAVRSKRIKLQTDLIQRLTNKQKRLCNRQIVPREPIS